MTRLGGYDKVSFVVVYILCFLSDIYLPMKDNLKFKIVNCFNDYVFESSKLYYQIF